MRGVPYVKGGKIAIKKNNNKKLKKNLTIIVLRISRDGQLQNSRPCTTCIRYLQQTGRIRKVLYSIDSRHLFACENLSRMMVTGYESIGTRYNTDTGTRVHSSFSLK